MHHAIRNIFQDKREKDDPSVTDEQIKNYLMDQMQGIYWMLDNNLIIKYISPSVEDVLGYKPEEVTGRNVLDFLPEPEKRRSKN